MAKRKVLITGAAGYVASRMLKTLREHYDVVLLDSRAENSDGESVLGVQVVDLIDPDRNAYQHHFYGVDAVIHLAHKVRSGEPIEHFFVEKQNVEMAYNVLRCAYETGVERVVVATSNHAADWYEHNLIHNRLKEVVDPYDFPLSDNFYGWAKTAQETMAFLFACGLPSFDVPPGEPERLLLPVAQGRKMSIVCVRIGHPRELDPKNYGDDQALFKRVLACYLSAGDQIQLFTKAIEVADIKNKHGVPFHIIYGISNNTRAFWSLANAREALGYRPEDDSEIRFAHHIHELLTGDLSDASGGRVGT